ncbi:hypothetical protein RBG61_11240 [Paludicola sp. MB14-C6]|uniref:hypothetical protein n=1 Tax=Paludihabitans sp. MB14-C6 TaxID=3070656 RepID=UPI0027DB122E|nr:hypothetical protein [Paludicola sp. MB14-C6]WMJ22559.1 hypothetical protein RBG61_11240 [Paludicola sp. MB14-C6]
MKNHKLLFIFTLLYFGLGFLNIHFALLGLICMALPLILLFKDKKKTWCQGYCPRASLYTKCGKTTSKFSRKTPSFFIKGNMKWIMLGYFIVSLSIIIISTVKVYSGANQPMTYLRFLIAIPIKGEMPQLFHMDYFAPWITHLSYRFYSMMMTTTTLGLVLALFYKPRTWCTICPIATISDSYIKSTKK